MRTCPILRSPDFELGGGGPADEFVTISKVELDDLRAKAGGEQPSRVESEPTDSVRRTLEEEWSAREAAYSREIADRERKANDLERTYKAALRDRELATALVGKSLVPGAAAQLIKLWRDDFEVVDDEGEIRVLAKDGRGVAQAVLDRLECSDFAHFCLPSSRGGTGSKGQNRSASSSSPQAPSAPRTLGEAVLLKWRESTTRPQVSPSPTGWGRRR